MWNHSSSSNLPPATIRIDVGVATAHDLRFCDLAKNSHDRASDILLRVHDNNSGTQQAIFVHGDQAQVLGQNAEQLVTIAMTHQFEVSGATLPLLQRLY